jgi:hypothetical protein
MDTERVDEQLRELCERDAAVVDEAAFMERLKERTGRLRGRSRAGKRQVAGRRSRRRVLVVAFAAVVVVAAVVVGSLELADRLGGGDSVLVIDDASLSPAGIIHDPSPGPGEVWLRMPLSSAKLELAPIWREAATGLGVDASTARLLMVYFMFAADGQLDHMILQGGLPDGREITVRGNVAEDAGVEYLYVRGSAVPSIPGRLSQSGSLAGAALPGVDTFFAVLDRAGLRNIVAESGLVRGDSMLSLQYSAPLLPPGIDAGGAFVTSEDELRTFGENAVWISVDGEKTKRLEPGQLASLHLPALRLQLSVAEQAAGSFSGATQTSDHGFVMLRWPETEIPGADVKAHDVDERLDGLAFTTPTLSVCRIQGGTAQALWQPDNDTISLVEYASALYGVAYSLGKTLVLRGTDILPPMVQSPDGSMSRESGDIEKSAVAIPADGTGTSWELLRLPAGGWLPPMSGLAFDERADRVCLSVVSIDNTVRGVGFTRALMTAQPHTSDLVAVALGHPFDGDFAVSPDGSALVYTGFADGAEAVTLRAGDVEKVLPTGLATAYHPAFSPDGRTVCLVGSAKVTDDTGLWLVDLADGDCRQIETTQGHTPTYPAFSPDGTRIAFRDWMLGDVWTVSVESGELTRYALITEAAPLAW